MIYVLFHVSHPTLTFLQVNFYMGRMPEVEEVDLTVKPLPENNVVNVIQKHEAQVHTSAFLRKISHDYINASAQLMDAFTVFKLDS